MGSCLALQPRIGNERFRIMGMLGSGGMAEVLLAEDLGHSRRVALKRSRPNPLARAMLAREHRVLARLDHPNVVRAHELIEIDGVAHLVLELVAGPRPTWHPASEDWRAMISLVTGIVRALVHIHARGVIHLDIKAPNIALDQRGVPRLIDFGIAACDGEPMPCIASNIVLGTPRSMAPEQITGAAVDGRTDLFALGAMLYELCTGAAPFAAESPRAAIDRVLDHDPPPVRSRVRALPRHFAELIDHLLEKDPILRPQSAAEVLARLR